MRTMGSIPNQLKPWDEVLRIPGVPSTSPLGFPLFLFGVWKRVLWRNAAAARALEGFAVGTAAALAGEGAAAFLAALAGVFLFASLLAVAVIHVGAAASARRARFHAA